MELLADTFKALSDETRLQIMVLLLEKEELCVCDFVGALDQTQSKISRHLRYLYNAGLVRDRREGLWMHYRLSPNLGREQARIVAALAEAVGEERKKPLREALQAWLSRGNSTEAGMCAADCCSLDRNTKERQDS